MHLIYVNRPSLEPGAQDLQLLVPGQAHASHFLSVRFWRERRRVGYEGLRERGERVVGVDVGKVLPTEHINVGQLVLVGQAADVVDVSVAEDIGVVACPDAVGPGRSRRQFKSCSNLMLISREDNSVITCQALSLPLPRVVKILDCKKFGWRAACADWEFRPGWLAKRGQGEQNKLEGHWIVLGGKRGATQQSFRDFGVLLYFFWALIDHLMG